MFEKKYEELNLCCEICEKFGHFSHECDLIHVAPKKESVIEMYLK